MDTRLAKFVTQFPGRLAVPLSAYSGLEITGESVEDMVSVPGTQFKAIMALQERYQTPVLLTAIDTTVEAEAYGCEVKFSAREAPAIVGRLLTSAADVAAMADPVPGDARTRVPLETAWRLTAEVGEGVPVLGAMLGPFALAGRLFGMEEAIAATTTEPDFRLVRCCRWRRWATSPVSSHRGRWWWWLGAATRSSRSRACARHSPPCAVSMPLWGRPVIAD